MNCCPFFFRDKNSFISTLDGDEEVEGLEHVKVYSYKELRNATHDFIPENKVGEGGFGSVYKGKLKDGTIAAIKVYSAESKQGAKDFLTEIKVMSNIEHENLVKLYGCCVEGDNRILVYGYVENNSLAHTLLGGRNSRLDFNWNVRRTICIGVATGLSFLHEEVKPHIVHRDINASNILLDENLQPKISDFGLAKLIPVNKTHVRTHVAGTIGYVAPEYYNRGQLTRKADIYSFGVLLLEIVSGRSNTNTQLPAEEQFLLEKTWNLYEEDKLLDLVDPVLVDVDAVEATRFLKVALLCTQDVAKLRPSMSRVIRMLTNKIDVNDEKISKPGLISDFMDLKVRTPKLESTPLNSSGENSKDIPTFSSSGNETQTSTVPAYDPSF